MRKSKSIAESREDAIHGRYEGEWSYDEIPFAAVGIGVDGRKLMIGPEEETRNKAFLTLT